jgi:16S rRNA processing protein RimM
MKPSKADPLIEVGALRGAHGVRGEVRVVSFTGDPEALFALGALLDASGRAVLTPLSARPGSDHFIVRATENLQKEDWDRLKGTRLYVPRSRLPPAEEGEFYVEDLIGLEVISASGATLGRVSAVQNFGAGDLVEIALLTGRSVLIPFTSEDFPEIDLEASRMTAGDLSLWLDEPGGNS